MTVKKGSREIKLVLKMAVEECIQSLCVMKVTELE